MANCMFLRRRYNTRIPVTIIGANGMSTLYVTINGVDYSGNSSETDIGVQETTVAVGDTITMYSGNATYKFYVNSAEQTKTNSRYVYTVPSGVKKIYIVISTASYSSSNLTGKYRGIALTDNDSYLMGLYVGTGQTSSCYAIFDDDTSKKYYNKGAANTLAATSLKFYAKPPSGQNMPVTINSVLVGTGTSTNPVEYTTNASGMRVLAIRGEYSSTNGYYLTAKTYF